ncbi:hypothetical protein WA158_006474 [Blastocystis sp. Blastoise]
METQGPFDEIRKHAGSSSAPKAKVNATLEVITSAIRTQHNDQNYEPTPVEYFAAIMSALGNDTTHFTELFFLLHTILPYLSINVKRSKCVETLEFLISIGKNNLDKIDHSASRSLIEVFSSILLDQEITDIVWTNKTIQKTFTILLNYCIDDNGKNRRCAQDGIKELLKSQETIHYHACWTHVVNYACNLFTDVDNKTITSVLQFLSYLYQIIDTIPEELVAKMLESLLQTRQYDFALLDQCCIRPISKLLDSTVVIPADILSKLHTVLLQYQSNIDNEEAVIQYIQCIMKCIKRAFPVIPAGTPAGIVPVDISIEDDLKVIFDYYMCSNTNIHNSIQITLSNLFNFMKNYLVSPNTVTSILSIYMKAFEFKYQHAWISIIKSFTTFLAVGGKTSAPLFYDSLRELEGIYENSIQGDSKFVDCIYICFGEAVEAMGLEHFLTALPLVETKDSVPSIQRYFLMEILKHHVKHTNSSLAYYFDNLLPIATKCLSLSSSTKNNIDILRYNQIIDDIWSLFPSVCISPIDVLETFPRVAKSLAAALTETKMKNVPIYVCKGLLVLIKMNQKVLDMGKEKKVIIKNELKEEDKEEEEDDDDDENTIGMKNKKGMNNNNNNNNQEKDDDNEYPFLDILSITRAIRPTNEMSKQILSMMSAFADNYISILFPIYEHSHGKFPTKKSITLDGIGEGGNIENVNILRGTIEGFMSLCTKESIHTYTTTILKSLLTLLNTNSNNNNNNKEDLSTISQCLIYSGLLSTVIPFVNEQDLSIIYRCLKAQFSQDNFPALQKRIYYCFLYICKYHSSFLLNEQNYKDVFELLINTLLTVSVNSKKYRLRCMYFLFLDFPVSSSLHLSLIPHVLPEIILCTKDSNKKIRDLAYDITIYIGYIMDQKQGAIILDNGQQFAVSLSEYYKILIGCITATSPHLQSATIQVLTRIIYAYKDKEETKTNLQNIMHVVYELMKQKNREVVKSCLGFVRTCVKILTAEELQIEIQDMCNALLIWSKDTKNRFRLKVRQIIERIYKKVGGDILKPCIPQSDESLYNYIEKEMKKSKTKKTRSQEDEDDDDDDDDESYISNQRKQTNLNNKKNRYINDKGIVDLMDRNNTSKNITTRKEKKINNMEGIKMTEQGKILVEMDEEEERRQQNRRGKIIKSTNEEENSDNDEDKEDKQKKTSFGDFKNKNNKKPIENGQRFKSKKSGGDVKRGGVDPYAYIQLDRRMLSKKKKTSSVGNFSNIIGAAKKGAQKGQRDAIRQRKGGRH